MVQNNTPEKLIPKLIYNMLNNRPLPIYGKGKNSREWIYVTDHCEALIKIFRKGKLSNFYNIGSNINLNNLMIVKKLLSMAKNKIKTGKKVKIKFVKDRPGHDLRYAINSNKIRKEIRWKPKININKGLEKTLDWYLDNQKYYSNLKKKISLEDLEIKNDQKRNYFSWRNGNKNESFNKSCKQTLASYLR